MSISNSIVGLPSLSDIIYRQKPTIIGLDQLIGDNNGKDVKEREFIILVHGTFGASYPWSKPGGDFYDSLKASLDELALGARILSFVWSGALSHSQRVFAGGELAKCIAKMRVAWPDCKISLMGHSHGGNVILIASQVLAAAVSSSVENAKNIDFENLISPIESKNNCSDEKKDEQSQLKFVDKPILNTGPINHKNGSVVSAADLFEEEFENQSNFNIKFYLNDTKDSIQSMVFGSTLGLDWTRTRSGFALTRTFSDFFGRLFSGRLVKNNFDFKTKGISLRLADVYLLATPINISYYAPNRDIIENIYNFYSTGDGIQVYLSCYCRRFIDAGYSKGCSDVFEMETYFVSDTQAKPLKPSHTEMNDNTVGRRILEIPEKINKISFEQPLCFSDKAKPIQLCVYFFKDLIKKPILKSLPARPEAEPEAWTDFMLGCNL